MDKKKLFKGNEAIAEAAVRGGCACFFGYPITPQNEIPEYLSWRLPQVGGHFIQAESEVSAINMVYGAAAAGARAMTSSSSPGISLKQEGISYLVGARLPCVIVNVMRAGPGLGGISPGQADYFQAVKGGGHGDCCMLVYTPNSIQEAVDLTYGAFAQAEKYRLPVMILCDGMLGQMMEPAQMPPMVDRKSLAQPDWAATGGHRGDARRVVNSLYNDAPELEQRVNEMFDTAAVLQRDEVRSESYLCDDAQVVLVAYGIVSRIAKSAVDMLRQRGVRAGLVRPITVSPFPSAEIARICAQDCVRQVIAVELSHGQMVEDVRLAVNGQRPVSLIYRTGGSVMSAEDITEQVTNNA